MYSESDLDDAVAAGAISRDAARALRNHVARSHAAPAVDEEHFRLLSGFNDIFVAIAVGLVLVALAWIGQSITTPLAGALVAIAAWGLAEYFTRQRRMALPSILLLIAFVGGVAATLVGVLVEIDPNLSERTNAVIGAGIGLVTAGAAWLHWKRVMVPITVAAGAAALVAVAVALTVAAIPAAKDAIYPILFAGGLAVFALAMWWDVSDRERRTRRSDVAFWLHLAAAPLIAHPVFHMLGVFNESITLNLAAIVLALYLVFAFVALAVDRRALLVSSLAYVLYAMYVLFYRAGAVELAWAFTALAIGSTLLTLSAFWHPMRRLVVGTLGNLSERLPPVGSMSAA
ncbi:MAG: hypothetical protein ABIY39_05690 [Sphingomonas sp.]